jgi:hypothetical protein
MSTSSAGTSSRAVIRTIHHFACTGGTVISRCVAALPKVVLLSEVTPAGKAFLRFTPLDPLEQFLANYPDLPVSQRQREAVFMASLQPVIDSVHAAGRRLVLRDHAHSDFVFRKVASPSLLNVLTGAGIETRSIVTIRYPLSSYLSAIEQKFLNQRTGFDQYCQEYLSFMKVYAGLPVFRFEDFSVSPDRMLKLIAAALDLDHDPAAVKTFYRVRLTGNSGRAATDPNIHPLLMKPVSDTLRAIAMESSSFAELCTMMKYPNDPAQYALNRAREYLSYEPESEEAQQAIEAAEVLLNYDGGADTRPS